MSTVISSRIRAQITIQPNSVQPLDESLNVVPDRILYYSDESSLTYTGFPIGGRLII